MNVSERRIGMQELRRAAADGALREVFGTGTAAVISPVGALRYRGEELVVNGGAPGDVSRKLFAEISGIQYGEIFDRYGWVHRVE
jgi:branched-chain amino acid aminotransferase